MRIPILYLCDVGSYSSCKKASCSRKKGGFCSHTMFREYSKNWKDAEPTTNELTLFFKYQAGSYWEQESKEVKEALKTIEHDILYGKGDGQ